MRRRAARPPAVVQVGGVHHLALGLRRSWSSSTTSTPARTSSTRASPTWRRRRRWAISSACLAAAWLVYDALCRALVAHEVVLAAALAGAHRLRRLGVQRAVRAAGCVPPGRRDARHDHGRRTSSSSIIPAHRGADPREAGGPRARPAAGARAKQRSVHNNYLTLPVLLDDARRRTSPSSTRVDDAVAGSARADGARGLGRGSSSTSGTRAARSGRSLPSARRRRGRCAVGRRAQRSAATRRGDVRQQCIAGASGLSTNAGCATCHTLSDAGAPREPSGRTLDARRPVAASARCRGMTSRQRRDARPSGRQAAPQQIRRRRGVRRLCRRVVGRRGFVTAWCDPEGRHRRLRSARARDHGRRLRLRGAPRGGGGAGDGRGVPAPAAARVADHPRPLVGRGRLDPVRRPRRRHRPRERHLLPAPRRDRPLSRAASPRPRSCSPTATSASPRRPGPLAGNHFATIVEGSENLRELGRKFLWEGAQEIVFSESIEPSRERVRSARRRRARRPRRSRARRASG